MQGIPTLLFILKSPAGRIVRDVKRIFIWWNQNCAPEKRYFKQLQKYISYYFLMSVFKFIDLQDDVSISRDSIDFWLQSIITHCLTKSTIS